MQQQLFFVENINQISNLREITNLIFYQLYFSIFIINTNNLLFFNY
jgi:hypothetical protein